MAYREYRCLFCDESCFSFENEEHRIRCKNPKCHNTIAYYELHWQKMPPNPVVIHQTECFLSDPVLDSTHTAMELDRILTREAHHLKNDKLVDQARRNA